MRTITANKYVQHIRELLLGCELTSEEGEYLIEWVRAAIRYPRQPIKDDVRPCER